jgi:Omp85 superfamily domain
MGRLRSLHRTNLGTRYGRGKALMNTLRAVWLAILFLIPTPESAWAEDTPPDGGGSSPDGGRDGGGASTDGGGAPPFLPLAPPTTPAAEAPAARPPAAAPKPASGPSLEFNIVPIAGGDSDVGIGGGEVADLARLDPRYRPYRWKVTSEAFVTFSLLNGQVISPFQDYSLLLTLPDLTSSRRLRLDIRASFTNERTLKFYGIGNATPLPPPGVSIADTEYQRLHPTLAVEARYRFYKRFYLLGGSIYTQNWLFVPPTSLLARAQMSPSPEVRDIVGTFGPHGVELLEGGLEYDSRDNETVTRHGQFHTAVIRVSPRVGTALPYGYERLTLTTRFYATPTHGVTLLFRLVGDTLLGDPPFYELARFDETPAIGGSKAVRGVPAQRYYGKVKVFENLEARNEILHFRLGHKRMVLGAALFLDAGCSWTQPGQINPALDGTGIGLKYGLGGGLRLQEGQTFIVRGDVAWSPDAKPVGAYFAAGEIF